MKKYSYDLDINASSEKEADEKMKAISVLAAKLSANALSKMANMVQNDPAKTAMALKALGV